MSPRPRPAFTLLELVIVMTIVGIIGLAVVPAFLSTDSARRSTDPVADVLRAAQRAAVDSGREVRVTVDPATGRYLATMVGADTALAAGSFDFSRGGAVMTDSVRAQFVFQPNGHATGDSMLVTGPTGRAIVAADPWTGGVVIRAY